jgi:hypothetical protein
MGMVITLPADPECSGNHVVLGIQSAPRRATVRRTPHRGELVAPFLNTGCTTRAAELTEFGT